MMWTALIAALLTGPIDLIESSAPCESIERLPLDDRIVLAEPSLRLAEFAEPRRFGERGSRRLQVHGAGGVDVKNANNIFGLGGVGVSYFIINNLSFDAEFNALYFRQRGSDAVAGNVNILMRWHFLPQETWSLYGEAGAGILLATRRVPHDGTRFNFTPQMGLGASFDLGDDVRLMTGVRWHHISNASLYVDNPGRDSVMAYVGVSFGF